MPPSFLQGDQGDHEIKAPSNRGITDFHVDSIGGSPNIADEFCLTCRSPPPVVYDMSLIVPPIQYYVKHVTLDDYLCHITFLNQTLCYNYVYKGPFILFTNE